VSSEAYASEPNPLKIIEEIDNMGRNFSEIVRLETIEHVSSPMVTEVVKFFDYGKITIEGERKATEKGVPIVFKRERPKTDSDYKQVRGRGGSRRSIPEFTIDSDLKEFTWGRSTRIFLQNYLSTRSAVHSERTPIIGGLYLTSAVRSKLTESRDSAFGVQYPVAKEIVKWLREWAHFKTLFFAMGNEKDHFEYKRDVERVFPANNNEAGPEVAIYCWNTTRSPIEARNLMFTEVR